MRSVWIGAFGMALLGSATGGWSLPSPPAASASAASSQPLILVRHHRHHDHGYSRHGGSSEADQAEPDAVEVSAPVDRGISGSDRPGPAAASPSRTDRDPRWSAPAIRWIDPEKSPR